MLLLDMFDNDKDVQAKGKQQKRINKLKKRQADTVGMLLGCCVANSVIATAMIVAMLNKQPFWHTMEYRISFHTGLKS